MRSRLEMSGKGETCPAITHPKRVAEQMRSFADFSGDVSSPKTVMFSFTACDSHFANLK